LTTTTNLEDAYARYRRDVYAFALRRTRNHHDAEDVTQQAFAEAASALANGDAPTSIRGWLCTVAARRIVDEGRRRARVGAVAQRLAAEPVLRVGDTTDGVVADAVERLPSEQRQVVLLRVLEGRSFREISATLHCDEATCRMRLTRALRTLRRVVAAEGVTNL
jgi:RNA polymerase sigma-70 factor (ECF subfamily)